MSEDDLKYMEERNMGSSCASHSLDIKDSDLEQMNIQEDVELEIDITTLDPDMFPMNDMSSEEE